MPKALFCFSTKKTETEKLGGLHPSSQSKWLAELGLNSRHVCLAPGLSAMAPGLTAVQSGVTSLNPSPTPEQPRHTWTGAVQWTLTLDSGVSNVRLLSGQT